jgi:hypothetical protein
VILPVEIVADLGAEAEAEGTTTLLSEVDARLGLLGTIALSELVRVRVGLDRGAELLERDQIEVLDVVRVRRIRVGALGFSVTVVRPFQAKPSTYRRSRPGGRGRRGRRRSRTDAPRRRPK